MLLRTEPAQILLLNNSQNANRTISYKYTSDHAGIYAILTIILLFIFISICCLSKCTEEDEYYDMNNRRERGRAMRVNEESITSNQLPDILVSVGISNAINQQTV